jgi:catechol 2,3-dioxygenase-like lactoylglutathione lyase family enzyme
VFDHVTIRVSDRAASERFYTTLLRTLDVEPSYAGRAQFRFDDGSFSLVSGTPTEHSTSPS